MAAQKVRLAILGVWLGAMALFSFVVAPSAFAVLPLPQLAGLLVSRVLGITEIIGIVLGVLLLLILFVARKASWPLFLIEAGTTALMTVAMLVSHFFISRRLHELRVQFGEISLLPAVDPNRGLFDRLHQYSVWLMSFDLLAALFLIVLLARRNADH